jgi:hypothetical protein
VLVVVPQGEARVTLDEVHAHMEGHFAKWQMPDDVVFVEDLPLTATGKVSKLTLREQFADYVLPELREGGDMSALDLAAVEAWARAHVPGFAGPVEAQKISGGQSNPTYRLITPGKALRAAPQAAGRAAQIRPRGGSRIPRAAGACGQRRAGRPGPCALRG